MIRRRRRRSSFSWPAPAWLQPALIGVGAIAFVTLFVFFIGQSDKLAPAQSEISVDLPDAFKE